MARVAKITPELYVKLRKELGSNIQVCRHIKMDESNFYKWKKRHQQEIDRLMTGDDGPVSLCQEKPVATDMTQRILKALKKETTIAQLSTDFDVSQRVMQAYIDDLTEQGYAIENTDGIARISKILIPQENVHEKSWRGDKIIRFGLCGDNQIGSKYTQLTYLHDYYNICEKEGIKDIYHTGDITEGEEMRQGHKYECYVQGADAYLDEMKKNYPKRKGMTTYFITGNHDHSLIKRAGYDIGKAIAKERDDLKCLGQSYATIFLTPNCKMDLFHPIDGTAYALSYKPQKSMDGMQGGEKPNILAIGHYHKAEYLPIYRNIHAFQTGCFQAQTPFMRGNKYIAAHVGGWIVEIHVDKEGTITRCKGEFIPYYKMIKEDYLNWK